MDADVPLFSSALLGVPLRLIIPHCGGNIPEIDWSKAAIGILEF